MTNSNQLFSNMYTAALERLEGRDPWQICARSGIAFDGNAFRLESLGQQITIAYPSYAVRQNLEPWHVLCLLHYLARANGSPLTGRQITFADHKDGMVRGGGFDREAEQIIRRKLGNLSPEELNRRCRSCGGIREPSNADLCIQFPFAPNYPVWLKIWFADEEFPASGRMLLDASAENYLSIEDAVTVGGIILDQLRKETVEL